MSLFKVRDCWSTACGRGETFGCDAVAVDDLFGAGGDAVVLGSLDGVLRVYGARTDPPPELGYSPTDLLLEVRTETPVLQTCTGRLVRSVRPTVLLRRTFGCPPRVAVNGARGGGAVIGCRGTCRRPAKADGFLVFVVAYEPNEFDREHERTGFRSERLSPGDRPFIARIYLKPRGRGLNGG